MNVSCQRILLDFEEKVALVSSEVPYLLELVTLSRQYNIFLTEDDMKELNTNLWEVSNMTGDKIDPKVRARSRYNFSLFDTDRDAYEKIVRQAKINGMLYIKDRIENRDDEFLRITYQMYLKNPESKLNKPTLFNLIESSSGNNIDYVKKCIQLEAISLMLEDCSVNYANVVLFSYFGLDFREKYKDILKQSSQYSCSTLFENDYYML